MTQASTNGGLHHEHDLPSPGAPTTLDDVVLAVDTLAHEVRRRDLVTAEHLQLLHDRGGEAEKVAKNRHDAVTTAIQAQSEATRRLDSTVTALGAHVETLARGLAPKAEVAALGAQMGRQVLDSIADGERQDAEIAKTKALATKAQALAVVRKGAFALGVAAGTALALEWRWAFKTLVSLFGG